MTQTVFERTIDPQQESAIEGIKDDVSSEVGNKDPFYHCIVDEVALATQIIVEASRSAKHTRKQDRRK